MQHTLIEYLLNIMMQYLDITIIPWAHVGYEVVNSQGVTKCELAITNLVSDKGEWNNCFIKFSTFGFAQFYLILQNDREVM